MGYNTSQHLFQHRLTQKPPERPTCLSTVQHLVPELRSLQVLLVFCLISAYELGPGPISWFIAAELFDQPSRPIAMAFTSMLNWGGKFVLALLFPPLLVGLYCWPACCMS